MNWSNNPHTFWILSAIVSFVRLKIFRCLQLNSNPWLLRSRCRSHMWEEPWWDSPEIVRIIASIHLSTTLRKHFFHSLFLLQEHMCLTDWPGESSAPASQWSWIRVPLKTPKLFQVHIWDDRWSSRKCEDHCFVYLSTTLKKHFFYPIWGYLLRKKRIHVTYVTIVL